MTVFEIRAARDGREFAQSFESLSLAILSRLQLRAYGWTVTEPEAKHADDAAPTFARDTEHICSVCWQPVTWTDHLPPPENGQPVRCLALHARAAAAVPDGQPGQVLLFPTGSTRPEPSLRSVS